RVVAYSTCSQLGYMFFAAGVGAYNAAMFHLFTHAFFKALLFLGAGSVIHGLHHEQDMRYMGGVRKPMPITWAMMTIGTLALIGFGIPGLGGFAGFYSKDAIIESAYASHAMGAQFAFWCGVTAALLTSFYSWRLAFMTFEGKFRGNPDAHHDDHSHAAHDAHGHDDHHAAPADGSAPAHESPWVMLAPLFVLAAGAVLAGVVFAPFFLGGHAEGFWNDVFPLAHEGHHELPAWVIWAPLTVTLTGFVLAVLFYLWKPGAAKAMAKGPVWAFLYNKWYFDELYNFIFVKGARALGDLFWKVGDRRMIDGLGPDGVALTSRVLSRGLKRVQTGFVYHYSFIMLIAAVAFGAYAIYAGIGGGR
ncbi:MAG: NADH-quinone oxidoreductase subunit L, partial [Hyphomonadaceae bacterium]|nr:NADH-quinone oxidoreductase subunit L [Hyphomonadaceae bacterium]